MTLRHGNRSKLSPSFCSKIKNLGQNNNGHGNGVNAANALVGCLQDLCENKKVKD